MDIKAAFENIGFYPVDRTEEYTEFKNDKTGEAYKLYSNNKMEYYVNGRLIEHKEEDYIEVAEKLYKHVNPESKMDTPNSVYEKTEKWYREWQTEDTELDLFNWILENKQNG